MKNHTEYKQIAIENLIRGQYQPRQHFDEVQLLELAEAIKTTRGLLQPIIVREIHLNRYEIIAGERRWRAALLAGLESVSCIIRDYTDLEALEAGIIENVSRTDLNPIEEAYAYQRLMHEFNYTHEKIATTVGKSRTKITNTLRMLKLDRRVQDHIIEGRLSEGHGKILVMLPDYLQVELVERIIKQGWSVRKVEKEVKRLTSDSPVKKTDKDSNIKALERALSDHIGCQVTIECEKSQGKLEINFHNLEVLDGLLKKMQFKFE